MQEVRGLGRLVSRLTWSFSSNAQKWVLGCAILPTLTIPCVTESWVQYKFLQRVHSEDYFQKGNRIRHLRYHGTVFNQTFDGSLLGISLKHAKSSACRPEPSLALTGRKKKNTSSVWRKGKKNAAAKLASRCVQIC